MKYIAGKGWIDEAKQVEETEDAITRGFVRDAAGNPVAEILEEPHVFWCRCPECKTSKVGIVIK